MIGGEYAHNEGRVWDAVGEFDPESGRVEWVSPSADESGLDDSEGIPADGYGDGEYSDGAPLKMWGDVVRELNGITSGQLAVGVREFVGNAVNRVLTVGREQYDEGDGQKFERMPLPQLCDWANEELEDIAVYAAMMAIRIQRIKAQFNGV